MPAARGVKRAASKASASTSDAPKIKKKHGITLEVPSAKRQRGRLYACGQGDVGQLGLGEDVVETPRFKFVSALGEKIVDVCAGGMHTVALDSDGKVWTFGCNDEGALGRAGEEQTVGRVELPRRAVAISAGDSHTAALLDDGHVWLWGSFRDSHGSMGLVCHGREGKSCSSPIRLDLPETVVEIASGGDHLLLLTATGAVYTMGCGEQGQLGRLSQRSASRHARAGLSALLQPAQVTLKVAMRRVWAGSHGSVALPAGATKLPVWGLNNYNQLGITGAKKKTAIYTPLEADAFSSVDDVESWTQVSCGQHHSLALDNNGKCYAVGRHDYGRLGLGEGSGDSEALAAIPKLSEKKCVSIAASTSSSFAVTDTGEVYAWGMGSEGQLGTGKEEDHSEPCLVSVGLSAPHKAIKISAGGQHTVLLAVNLDDPVEEEEPTPPAAEEPAKVEAKEAKEPKAAAGRRGRAARRDEEAAATSAEVMDVDESGPEKKLNGDEDSTPMETDETDKPQEPIDNKETDAEMDTEKTETSKDEPKSEEPKPKEAQEEETTPQVKEDIAEDKMEVKQAESTPTETELEQKVTETESKVEEPVSQATETVSQAAETEVKRAESEAKVVDSTPAPVENSPQTESKVTEIESKLTEVESKPTKVESKPTEVESKPTEVEKKPAEVESKPEAPESNAAELAPKDVEMSVVNGEEQTAEIVEKKITNTEPAVGEAL